MSRAPCQRNGLEPVARAQSLGPASVRIWPRRGPHSQGAAGSRSLGEICGVFVSCGALPEQCFVVLHLGMVVAPSLGPRATADWPPAGTATTSHEPRGVVGPGTRPRAGTVLPTRRRGVSFTGWLPSCVGMFNIRRATLGKTGCTGWFARVPGPNGTSPIMFVVSISDQAFGTQVYK